LFIEVSEQMKRFDANVSSRDAALEETPEVLKTIRVNLAVNVCSSMVNYLMGIVGVGDYRT
jgi:hypothetical protein